MTRKFTLLILMFFIGASTLVAQTTLSGTVRDDEGEPVILGTVAIYRGGELIKGAETDFDGNYYFSNIDPGTYDVEFSYVGFPTLKVSDVVISGGKSNKLDADMQKGLTLDVDVIVVGYKKPLIEVDNASSGGIVTSEEIGRLPVKTVGAIAGSTAGVATSEDGSGNINMRGSRNGNTSIILDGIRVSGNNIPQSEIEQLQVITGGIEAQYGDVTGGIISITTKGPSRKYSGGVELETSEFLDAYGYNLISANVSGPILKKKAIGDQKEEDRSTLLGFRLSGQYRTVKDTRPSAKGVYALKEDRIAALQATPILRIDGGNRPAAEFITNDDVELLKAQPNEGRTTLDLVGKLDAKISDAIDMTLSGTFNSDDDQFTPGGRSETNSHWRLFNNHNNPTQVDTRYRGNFRFRHRIGGAPQLAAEGDETVKKSLIENVMYILQLGYEKGLTDVSDKRHGANFFDYGHIGQFNEISNPVYESLLSDDSTGIKYGTFIIDPTHPDGFGWLTHTSTNQDFDNYVAGSENPTLANYNQFIDQTTESAFVLTNGQRNQDEVFGLHRNIGQVYNLYRKRDNETYTFNATSSFDLIPGDSKDSRHSIQLGFNYEQRFNRGYDLNPRALWLMAQSVANVNLVGNGMGYEGGSIGTDTTIFNGNSIIVSTYGLTSIDNPNNKFYKEVRTKLGLNDNEWVNVNGISPSDLALNMFTAGEVNQQNILTYWGYDHTGQKVDNSLTFDDFFKSKDEAGRNTYLVAPVKPIYWSAYLQDKFTLKDIIFRVGLRVDRFDANTKVLKDKYSLYETYGFDDFNNEVQGGALTAPGGITNEHKVYTTSNGGTTIAAYRKGDTWFYPNGVEAVRPEDIFGQGLAFPALTTDGSTNIQNKDFKSSSSFTDYLPQLNFAPRLAFSFPISQEVGKEAGFFAHYDVLVQRPTSGNLATALDYFYFAERPFADNPNLKPEKTIDYEVGFKQALSTASAITVQAYYRELRDMIQRTAIKYTWPNPNYDTFDNIDFGTVKGFTFTYDLRRTNRLTFNTSYTLQFADGTGSAINASASAKGDNRTPNALNFDERHKFNFVMDYRFKGGKKYSGPKWWGMNVFQNMGLNIQASAVSGRPYTAKSEPNELSGDGIVGKINGARLPWNYTINAQLDKDFQLSNKGDGLYLNVYLRVQNLLDTRNIIDVYEASASPDNDGYLESVKGKQRLQSLANSGADTQLYRTSYQWRLLNPAFYSLPRRIFLGMRFNF